MSRNALRPAACTAASFLVVFLLPIGGASGLAAQDEAEPRPDSDEEFRDVPARVFTGGSLGIAQPMGEFSDFVQAGIGLQGFLRAALEPRGILNLRLDIGFQTYGQETQRVPLSSTTGGLIEIDLTTSNNILMVGIGPELAIPVGPARLYGFGSAGYTYFHTDSRVEETTGIDDGQFRTRNHSDGGFGWNGGGGLQMQVSGGRTPIWIDVGATYFSNGHREYVTPEGIIQRSDGQFELNPVSSEADFVVWRLGVSVGLRPVPPEPEPEPEPAAPTPPDSGPR